MLLLRLGEEHFILESEIVDQVDPQVRFSKDVVFAAYYAIDKYVDCEAIGSKLGWDLFIYLHKHVVRTLHNRFLRFFFAHRVSQSQLVQRNLTENIVKRPLVNFLSIRVNQVF